MAMAITTASLRVTGTAFLPPASSRINAAISLPKQSSSLSPPKLRTGSLTDEHKFHTNGSFPNPTPLIIEHPTLVGTPTPDPDKTTAVDHLYAVLEAISHRIEMHNNVGEQRDSWNSLLLNSINMITLSATAMAGVASATDCSAALNLGSTLLFAAATGLLALMNTIQPSQLVEEQRNARRFLRQLRDEVEHLIARGSPTEEDVGDAMEKVQAIDRAYPLPLIGVMLPKFPQKFEPAVWWPKIKNLSRKTNRSKSSSGKQMSNSSYSNGWSQELETELREIVEVIKRKDHEDYDRLGNVGTKLNKALAISGPALTGVAAVGAAFMGHHSSGDMSWGALVATVAGAAAAIVNTVEHGGQVGMVVEMYRTSGGFFKKVEETIETALAERDVEKRENGELLERKVALQLGRSLSQLRDFAKRARYSRVEGSPIDEFASKLF